MMNKVIDQDLDAECRTSSYEVDLRSMDTALPSLLHEEQRAGSILKRWADVLVAILVLLITAPLILTLSLIIRRDGGPAFFRQQRIGRNGKPITVLKLRSMEVGAEEVILRDERLREQYKSYFKLTDDPRVTTLGKLLRITCIDELPQLINVILGDMSLVGPRPVLYEETLIYGESRELILSVQPGMTGWWQIHRTEDTDYAERVRMEAWYVSHWSLLLDCKIMLQTSPYIIKTVVKCLINRQV